MANVMTTSGALGCKLGGKATLTSSAKLTVGGQAVLLEDQVSTWSISGCSQTDASKGQVQCTAFVTFTGKAQKLTVSGKAVLLDTFSGVTNGNPDATSAPASAGQSKLTAS